MRRSIYLITVIIAALTVAMSPVGAQEDNPKPRDAAAPPPIPDVDLPPKVQNEQFKPTVRITTNEKDEVIEEYSSSGRVYLVKVTPKHGKPYFYRDMDGDGQLELQARDDAFPPVNPVVWKVKEW